MFDRSMPIPLASLCALVCITAPSLRAGDDPKEILRRALNVNSHNHELALAYTYVERDEQRTLDKAVRLRNASPLPGCHPLRRNRTIGA